jgi:hypothetical protein
MTDNETIRRALNHAVTEFDRKSEAKAAKNPRHYHNAYALPQYLGRVSDIMRDIEAGASTVDAIVAGFTPGPLRNACLKAICATANNTESSGSYLGLPVYRPASQR